MGDVRREGGGTEVVEDAVRWPVDVRDQDVSEVGGEMSDGREVVEDDREWQGPSSLRICHLLPSTWQVRERQD